MFLIKSDKNFDSISKIHISLHNDSIEPLCKANLSLSYEFVTNSGIAYDDPKDFSKKEVMTMERICKKCLKKAV